MKKMLIAVMAIAATLAVLIPLSACAGGHKHEYGAWVTTKEATCTEQGERQRECKCGNKQTEKIPAGHKVGGWIIDGASHKKVCTVCGETTAQDNHTFSDGKCTVCGAPELSEAKPVF